MTSSRINRVRAIAAAVFSLAVFAGCAGEPNSEGEQTSAPTSQSATETTSDDGSQPASEGFPRTVEVGDASVTLEAQPQRIAAITTEVGDIVLALRGHEAMVAVSDGSVNEGMGNELEEAKQVGFSFPPGYKVDPEQIMSLNPDLVMLVSRHDSQHDVAALLKESGIPTVTFGPGDFNDPKALAHSMRVIGQLVGAEEKAEELASTIEKETEEIVSKTAGLNDESPRVLTLLARGDEKMFGGMSTTPHHLIEAAHGISIAAENKWRASVPADVEQLIVANPDIILVEDFRGAGLKPFEQLLNDPAVSQVPAIANDQVHLLPAREVSGTAGVKLTEGLKIVAKILHPDAFSD